MKKILISIIVPIYNEEKNIPRLYREISKYVNELKDRYLFEYLFIDDGSDDGSLKILNDLKKRDKRIKIIEFTRNFGKEIATTAGINYCLGKSCILIDADLQHPPKLIPKFIQKWDGGAEVVIGVRKKTLKEGLFKRIGAYLFYKLMNSISDTKLIPNATDYRLLDRTVIDEFNRLTERNRITRGLIAWLGFKQDFIYFTASPRQAGEPGYGFWKLVRLAFNSFVGLSLFPLKFAGYLGIFIIIFASFIGGFIFIEQIILDDPLGLNFSGSAMLAIILLFLVGIILISLGLMALYIANIHGEIINRPIYVIRKHK